MLKSIFLLFLVTFMIVGCNSSDSEPLQVDIDKPFTVYKGTINNAPVPINQKVYLEFSAPLNISSIDDSTAYMLDENNISVGLYIGIGNPSSKIILTPFTFLEPSKSYTIVVTTGVKDVNGRSLSEDYRYEFTTQTDSVDTAPLAIRSFKPDRDAPTVLVQSEIAIDFSKNLSLEPQYTADEYIKVTNQAGSPIAGRTEVFNSLLKFIPAEPLPYEEYITVELMRPVLDMFNESFTDLTAAKWSFTTKSELQSPKVNLGFASLSEYSSTKRASLIRTIYNNSGESKIAVATQDGIDIYLVEYSIAHLPTFRYMHGYPLPSKINAMVSVLGEYLIVGTMNDGIEVLKVLPTSLQTLGTYITSKSVYGLSLGENIQGVSDKLYAVGPELGLQIFHLDPAGSLTVATNTSVGEAVDVTEATEHDIAAGMSLRKIYIADYNGSVVVCDENGTLLVRTDLNTSVKKLTFNEDYNGKLSLLAIGSSGKMQGLGFDGSIFSNVKLDLLSNIYDVKSFVDSYNMISNLYFSGGSSGILVTSGDYPNSIIDTGGSVVSSDIVLNSVNNHSYLVTLNEDGRVQIFNALADTYNPYASTIPYSGEIVSSNGFSFVTTITDTYLDIATITKDSFVLRDLNNSALVDFTFDIAGSEYKLIPVSPLSPDTNYSVTISGNIADMMGHKLNGGAERVVNFQTNSDIALLPAVSINNIVLIEDENASFVISINDTSTTAISFDYETAGGTAEDGFDYISISGRATILAGDLNTSVLIETKDDYRAEPTETFYLNLSNPSANTIIGDNQGLGTITDEVAGAEDTADVGISGLVSVNEGNSMSFTLAVSKYAITPLTINLKITHISTDSSDIVTPSIMSVTILAADNNATFTIETVDDTLSESDENLSVEIVSIDSVNNGGYEKVVIGGAYSSEGTTTIIDNDTAGGAEGHLNLSSKDALESDDFMEFTVIMEEAISSEITFDYITDDISTTVGDDYSATYGSGTITAGELSTVVNVPIIQDSLIEGDEQLTLEIYKIVNATVETSVVAGTIIDDDY